MKAPGAKDDFVRREIIFTEAEMLDALDAALAYRDEQWSRFIGKGARPHRNARGQYVLPGDGQWK